MCRKKRRRDFRIYEAVREDFEIWYPRVRPGGLVLFHDVRARVQNFGAWKFWDELVPQHASFIFDHGFGLGVLRKDGGSQTDHELLKLLFESSSEEATELRRFYVHAGQHLEAKRQVNRFRPNGSGRQGGQGKPTADSPNKDGG